MRVVISIESSFIFNLFPYEMKWRDVKISPTKWHDGSPTKWHDVKALLLSQGMMGKLGLAAGLGSMAGPLFTPIIKHTHLIEKGF